ncbi:MAG: D,D-heptose 1,7-bisphosphate phosphatase [Phycisphaeraceae bacterium]|nr:D,D-heptose 1,7-bisphosphate phosphatase [Phycisphaeraceae bacterium]
MPTRPAAFLDRDGTVIEHVHYLCDPAKVRLIAGAAQAIRTLGEHGYASVIVTNQSVIGRGMLTEEGLAEVHDVMVRQLADEGARLDGIYYCPLAPTVKDRRVVEDPDRKPGPGMLLRAARDLDLDVARSWMIGDTISDALAGRNAEVRGTIIVRTGDGADVDADDPAIDAVAPDLIAAARLILDQG